MMTVDTSALISILLDEPTAPACAASLNVGDCFAYEAAVAHGGRLLSVGDDFAKTDLVSVLACPTA